MSRKRESRKLRYEGLEHRCLLAADLAMGASCIDGLIPEQIVQSETADLTDRYCATMDGSGDDGFTEIVNETESQEAPVASENGTAPPTEAELGNESVDDVERLDLADGIDGTFGLIDSAETDRMIFVAPENGTAEIALATRFGDADTNLEVRSENGDLVFSSSIENLEGFQKIAFDVQSDTSYHVSVSSDASGSGEYQMTVSFEVAPVTTPTDQHADAPGATATHLELVEGEALISGTLETSGDIDMFQFAATCDGEASIFAAEMTEGIEQDVAVTVTDATGVELASGTTNEFMELRARVDQGETYFVAVSANDGLPDGQYHLAIRQAAETGTAAIDDHADAPDAEASPIDLSDGFAMTAGEIEITEDVDAFRWVAVHDGPTNISATMLSEGQAANLSLTVLDAELNEVTQGSSNQQLELTFAATAGQTYQLLVDSINDLPANYLMTTIAENAFQATDETDLNFTVPEPAQLASIDPLVQWAETLESRQDKFRVVTPADESQAVDSYFSEAEMDLEVDLDLELA